MQESEPEPDVSVVTGALADADAVLPSRALLIVEVSDSSLALDRIEKASLYVCAGIADYWESSTSPSAYSKFTASPHPNPRPRTAGATASSFASPPAT